MREFAGAALGAAAAIETESIGDLSGVTFGTSGDGLFGIYFEFLAAVEAEVRGVDSGAEFAFRAGVVGILLAAVQVEIVRIAFIPGFNSVATLLADTWGRGGVAGRLRAGAAGGVVALVGLLV